MKTVLRGKIIILNAYIEKRFQKISNEHPTFTSYKEKEEQEEIGMN